MAGWSVSGEEGWLLRLDEAGALVSNAMVECAAQVGRLYIMQLCTTEAGGRWDGAGDSGLKRRGTFRYVGTVNTEG